MFINNFDPVAFNFLIFEIRWYSISYILGILIGWLYIKYKLIEESNLKELFDDFIVYLVIGIILGGRIGYILFYNFKYYFNNPAEILYIWQGGMSFHGGLIGIILMSYHFSRKNKINIFFLLDRISLVAPIGIFFGRLSNFVNSELYGIETDLPWGVKFIKVDEIIRHPSQIYEAFFEGLILFFILNFFFRVKIKVSGFISGLFITFYSIFRFIIEFTREPDAQLGFIFYKFSMGQVLSLFAILIGLTIIYLKNEKKT